MANISHGKIEKWGEGSFTILEVPKSTKGTVHYNPSIARDDKGNTWISIRSCIVEGLNPTVHGGVKHPMHYINYLHVGKLDEKTLKITELKEIKPKEEYEGHQWGLEDARIFWREDGLHAIAVALPVQNGGYGVTQAEVLIDHDKGVYELIADYGNPKGVSEKNWSPTAQKERLFDFAYSNSQTVLIHEGQVELLWDEDSLQIHNGTQLLRYGSGFIQLSHLPLNVDGCRTYVQVAILRDHRGVATHRSQFWVWGDGWRETIQETIEFASGLLWKDENTLLASVGLEDEYSGITEIPLDKLEWQELKEDERWYKWRYDNNPSNSN